MASNEVPDEVYIVAEIIIDGIIERLKDMAEETCTDCPLKLVSTNKESC